MPFAALPFDLEQISHKEKFLLSSLKNPDPHYLDKHVETLTFLLPEIKELETLQRDNAEEEQIYRRLQFLKEGENRIVFSEEHIRNGDLFTEVEEKQQHPIEMNEEDLKKAALSDRRNHDLALWAQRRTASVDH